MKQYHRYRMNFDGKAVWLSGIFVGLPIFLLAVHYLILNDYGGFSLGTKILSLWVPVGLCLIYVTLLRIVRWNAPGVYAIIGALFCVMLIIGLFSTGNVLRIVLGILGYLICGAVLILAAGGYLPGRLPAAVCFAAVLAIRLFCFDLGKVTGIEWVPEIASLCEIAGMIFLPMGMIPGKIMKETEL